MWTRFQWWQAKIKNNKLLVMGAIATPVLLSMVWGFKLPWDHRLELDDAHLSHNEKTTLVHQHRQTPIRDLGIIATVTAGLFVLVNFRFASRSAKIVNLSGADLNGADLKDSNLSKADLSSADLNYANLSGANLRYANLRYANLSGADLSGALLFFINSRDVQNLEPLQLEAKPSPFLCHVALPPYAQNLDLNPNRDCHLIPQLLSDRYDISLQEAQYILNEARRPQWD
ncbi:MAG TPA: pentapeptide repeat-containing protein [Cyanothece sp. UBA12306]|nr:pentapeptide repeat-containing protein [Cyanothece sp. UBA12306]